MRFGVLGILLAAALAPSQAGSQGSPVTDRIVPGSRRRHLRLLRSLVRVGGHDRPGSRLPAARLPQSQVRAIREAIAARPRYATVRDTARALHVSPSVLRGRLRLGRGLLSAGGIRRAGC